MASYTEFWTDSLLFLLIELFTSSGFLLFFGASALIVALLPLMISTIPLSVEIVVFSIVAVLSALGWKMFSKRRRV